MDSGGHKEAYVRWAAHWPHLVNTTEPSMCGGDAAFLSNYFDQLLWLPCVADAVIIFLPCGFFYLLLFFSSPILSRSRLDVYHTYTHGVALVRI